MNAFWNIENIEDVIICVVFLFIYRDEDIKIILRSLW
jgi:hypothetical protein